jgi:hypothetical protein
MQFGSIRPFRREQNEIAQVRLRDCNGLTRSYSGQQVRFWAVGALSDVFQSQVVIHRVLQFLFTSKIVLGRLNRCVPQQKLNLFKVAASQVAQSSAGTAQVMRSEILDTGTFRSRFDDMPNGFRCETLAPDLFWPAYSPEERTCTYLGCRVPRRSARSFIKAKNTGTRIRT